VRRRRVAAEEEEDRVAIGSPAMDPRLSCRAVERELVLAGAATQGSSSRGSPSGEIRVGEERRAR
jgi:hypothetical protein